MNKVRTKIVLSWLLFLAFVAAVCLHQNLVGWLIINPLQLLVRFSLPRPASKSGQTLLERRMEFILRSGIILFLILVLIHALHPFPPAIVTAGEILGLVYLFPVFAYTIYLDCLSLKQPDNPGV